MSSKKTPQILVGPRYLNDKICRLVYVRATDEVWTEEWSRDSWVRTSELIRRVLQAPTPKPAQLKKQGVPLELGVWDREEVCA